MKKILLAFQLLIFSFFLAGCTNNEMRYNGGFGRYINQKFAKKLETCINYTTPTYYYTTGVIQLRKHKLKIAGPQNNMCIIRLYDTGILPPRGDNYETYNIPMKYVTDLSNIMQQAFKEPEYHEKEAVEMALNFCRKLEISNCLMIHNVSNEKPLYHYMSSISEFFSYEYKPENNSKIEAIKAKREQEKQICTQMITSVDNLIKRTANFADLSNEEKEKAICNNIRNAQYCRYSKKSNTGLITREYKINNETLTSCWANFNENGVIESHNWEANINNILNK